LGAWIFLIGLVIVGCPASACRDPPGKRQQDGDKQRK